MITYKVRRKLDGKFARNQGFYYNYERCSWGVGQTYSERAFKDVVRLYNNVGCADYKWQNGTQVPNGPDFYDKIELVKYGPNGEIVVCTNTHCTLTAKQAAEFEPAGRAEPTLLSRQAGIRDEIGPLLDQINEVEASLDAGKETNVDKLFAEIEMKEFKLKVALDELYSRNKQLRDRVKNIF